jgi:hypothetical protein
MSGKSPRLQVIEGDLNRTFIISGITLRLSALERGQPHGVEALVVEQDTSLLLDDSLQLEEAHELPTEGEGIATIAEQLLEQEVHRPLGTIFLREGHPQRILMVIHDLNQEPSWSESTISQALRTLFSLLPRYHLRSLALPALAHRYGPLPVSRFLELLCQELQESPPLWRGELWLLVPRHTLQASLEALGRLCDISRLDYPPL